MKKTEPGLSITPGRPQYADKRLTDLLTGAALLLGAWGMGAAVVSPAVLAAALTVGAVLLPADRRKKWTLPALSGAGLGVLLAGIFRREAIASGLGAMGNAVARILTARTGYYFYQFESSGRTLEGDLAVGCLLGLTAVLLVRAHSPIPALAAGAAVLAACVSGIFTTGLWLAVFLLGLILVLAGNGSDRKGVLWTAVMAAVFGTIVLAPLNGTSMEPSERALNAIHQLQYESTEDPLPEGWISGTAPFTLTDAPALEITMSNWSGLYLRGFTGSVYTGEGWEAAAAEESADLLYTLQKSYFHPEMQLSAANSALDHASQEQITVRVLGACGAFGYLPYGAGGVETDPRELVTPSLDSFSGSMYPLQEAYLIQKELSDGAGEQRYLDAEAAYREWVYGNCLAVPQELRVLLISSETALNTTQAKEAVLAWLQEVLKYDEYATVSGDAAKTLLTDSPYGCSFHYATLGTLALRNLGIPARYVEGYAVSRSEAAGLGAGETLTVTGKHAHAWVEYYLDGVGWIPFEVTPGRENELVYQLPPDGSGPEEPEPEEPDPTEPEEPPVKQQPDPGSQTRLHMTKLVRNILLLLLALTVCGYLVRVWVLRKRLRERLARFRREADRETMLDCLGYQMELMALPERNVPILDREAEISEYLPGFDVHTLLLTAQELRFSDHPVTEAQHRMVTQALDRVLEVWKQKTPPGKRLEWKWLRCKAL